MVVRSVVAAALLVAGAWAGLRPAAANPSQADCHQAIVMHDMDEKQARMELELALLRQSSRDQINAIQTKNDRILIERRENVRLFCSSGMTMMFAEDSSLIRELCDFSKTFYRSRGFTTCVLRAR
jgi:uncharacterized protein with PIN domain